MNIFKSFCFSLTKKKSRNRPKISAPAPAKKTSAPIGSATLVGTYFINLCRTFKTRLTFKQKDYYFVGSEPYRNA